ncbi:MAG: DUF1800 domain-containing protein [Anaerolineae bacterium]|nr:DUF1800 domain-containing protein [Anaerolineae bacterium]
MAVSRRAFLKVSGLAALGVGLAAPLRWAGVRPTYAAEVAPTLHVLNRLTFGPRPEDVARIEAMGIEAYIDWQLAPDDIPDPVLDAFLAEHDYATLDYNALAVRGESDDMVEAMLMYTRLVRAAFSERQLFELMVEFWTDHFNVPFGDLTVEKAIDDRDVIRRHALGRFRDLLFASAHSPAMLYYLNQDTSTAEHPNENYAREVMELHTLGVDGGYTEQDVKEVARALTGWTVREGAPGRFFFNADDHDTGEKTVLGKRLAAGRGIEDGLDVLDLLAEHPSTARYISKKLCRRFVSDDPPQGIVDSTTGVFSATGGDIRAVMRHILTSPDFMAAPLQKFRRPIDFMAAAYRAVQPEVDDVWIPLGGLYEMGQPPFHWHPPDGYPDVAPVWVNTNGLLARWNAAMFVAIAAHGWIDTFRVNLDALVGPADTAAELVDATIAHVFPGATLDEADRQMLVRFVSDGAGPKMPVSDDVRADRLPTLFGLLLASPYFQWH